MSENIDDAESSSDADIISSVRKAEIDLKDELDEVEEENQCDYPWNDYCIRCSLEIVNKFVCLNNMNENCIQAGFQKTILVSHEQQINITNIFSWLILTFLKKTVKLCLDILVYVFAYRVVGRHSFTILVKTGLSQGVMTLS